MPFFMYPLYYTNFLFFLYPKSISYLEYYMNKIPHRYFPNIQIKVNPMKKEKKIVLQEKLLLYAIIKTAHINGR